MAKKKTSPFVSDPRYAEGMARRAELLGTVGQEIDVLGEALQSSGRRNFDVFSEDVTAPRDIELYPNVDENGIIQRRDEDGGLVSSIGHFLFGDYENAGERFEEGSAIDSYRMFHKKRLQAELGSAEKELNDTKQVLKDLDEAQKYADLITRYKENQKQLAIGMANGVDDKYLAPVRKQISDDAVEIKRMQLEFKDSGRKSAVLTELFFDPDKLDWTNFTEDWDVKSDILAKNLWIDPKLKSEWYRLDKGVEQLASWVSNLFMSGANAIGKIPHALGDYRPEWLGENNGAFTWRAIRNSESSNRVYDKLFNPYMDEQSGVYNDDNLRNKIKNYREYYEKENDERQAEVKLIADKYKNGAWFYDPKKINPKFAELQENQNGGLLGIFDPTRFWYNLPELGTSFSDFEDFLGLMATDAGVNLAVAKLSQMAMKRSPYIAAYETVMKGASGLVKGEELTKAAETLAKTAAKIKNIEYAAGVGEIAADVALIKNMRRLETNAEVTDAYTQRLISEAQKRKIDLNGVISEIEDYMIYFGYDPSQFDALEKLELCFAYDIPTSNKEFNSLRDDCMKGINKVYNDNNTLAVKDYLEALPFMPYHGKFIRNFFRNDKNMLQQMMQDYGSITAAGMRSANHIAQSAIGRAASKFASDPMTKAVFERTGDYVAKKIKQFAPVGFMEGIEEGQQHLLQTRFARGEYDAYDSKQSMFDIPSIFEDNRIGFDALSAYLGLNFGDPDNGTEELRRAINVGLTTGMLFGGAHTFTNLAPTEMDNLRNLIAQIKNDRVVKRIIGENYGAAEDDKKVSMFYDALKEYGVTPKRLRESLSALKSFKGKGVSDEFVDEDIELLNRTVFVTNSDVTKERAKRLHIDENTDAYKDLVRDGVKHILDYEHAERDAEKTDNDLQSIRAELLNIDFEKLDNNDPSVPDIYKTLYRAYKEYQDSILNDKTIRMLAANEANISRENFDTDEEYEQYIDRFLKSAKRSVTDEKTGSVSEENYIIPREEYMQDMLSTVFAYKMLKSAKAVKKMFSDRKEFSNLIHKLLGTDIDTEKLSSMLDYVDKYISDLESGFKETAKEYRISNIKSHLEKFGKLPSDMEAELERTQYAHLLNNAAAETLKPLYEAYAYGEVFTFSNVIQRLRPKRWGELTKEQQDEYAAKLREQRRKDGKSDDLTVSGIAGLYTQEVQRGEHDSELKKKISKLNDDYKKKKSTIDSLEEGDRTPADQEDLAAIRREVADLLVADSFAEQNERKLVAHRQFEEELGVTPHDISEAERGNKEAEDKIKRDIEKESESVSKNEDEDVAGLGSIENVLSAAEVSDDIKAELYEDPESDYVQEDLSDDHIIDSDVDDLETVEKKASENKEPVKPEKQNNADDGSPKSTTEGKRVDVEPDPIEESKQYDDHKQLVDVDSWFEDPLYQTIEFLMSLKDGDELFVTDDGAVVAEVKDNNGVRTIRFKTIDLDGREVFIPLKRELHLRSYKDVYGNEHGGRMFVFDTSDGIPLSVKVYEYANSTPIDVYREGVEINNPDQKHENEQADSSLSDVDDVESTNGELYDNDPEPIDSLEGIDEDEDFEDDADTLQEIEDDDAPLYDYENSDDVPEDEKERAVKNSQKLRFNFVGRCFFYEPSAKTTLDLKISGESIKLANGRSIVQNSELGRKLAINGWFEKANKYYIVTENANTKRTDKDTFTVAMVIEDPDNTTDAFVVTMRMFVGDKPAFWWLLTYHMTLEERKQLAQRKAKAGNAATNDFLYTVRDEIHDPDGEDLIPKEKIESQLKELREIRNEIIEACCVFNKLTGEYIPNGGNPQVKDNVKPKFPRISHGAFNVQTKGELHTFRPIVGKDAGFNMPSDSEELTKAINSTAKNRPIIGYGYGQFGNRPNEIGNIVPGNNKAGGFKFYGRGYAGKIYAYVEAPGGGERVPVMLHEERFNRQEKNGGGHVRLTSRNDIVLAIDPKTGKIRTGEYKPCIGEVILQLLLGNVDKDEIGGNKALAQTIVNLIVNNGEKTIVTPQSREYGLPYYELKQLSITNEGLLIGTMEGNVATSRVYSRKQLEEDEDLRKDIVWLISKNFHWNTDRDYMNSNFATEYKGFDWRSFVDMLGTHFKSHNTDELKIYGLDQLSFKKNDFFDKDGEKKYVSVLAWMLCNGKLSTDLGDQLFRDPFVYSSGVSMSKADRVVNDVKGSQLTDSNNEEPSLLDKDSIDVAAREIDSKFNENPIKDILGRFKNKITRQNAVRNLINLAMQKREDLKDVHEDFGRLIDRIILSPDMGAVTSKNSQQEKDDALKNGLLNSIRKYVNHINKSIPDGNKFTEEQIQKSIPDSVLYMRGNSFLIGDVIPVLIVYEKHIQVRFYDASNVQRIPAITGVFSKIRGNGKLNEKRARKELLKLLGLTDRDVIVVDGYLKASTAEDVFGVTSLAIDSINNTVRGVIALSEMAGKGIHYHEAWHFVNLLLHDSKSRENIYRAYVKDHPELKSYKYSDIEELMAEDFRKYMEGYLGIEGVVRKFFDSVRTFIGIGEDKSLIKKIYKDIRLGGYKNRNYDVASIKSFAKKYPKGIAASMWVPGVDEDTIKSMTAIHSYHEFYSVGEALAQQLLKRYKVTKVEDVAKTKGLFSQFIENLKEDNKIDKDPIVDDILRNVGAFKQVVTNVFAQYGLNTNWKRINDLSERTAERRDIGDETNFAWDIDDLSISKKDNIRFRAKLFLSQIEKTYYELDESSPSGKVLRTKMNEIFTNFPDYVPFSQAWNKVLNSLWSCETYDKKSGNDYHKKSILGMAKRLGVSDPFFQKLYENLEEVDDEYLKAEIFGAIKSSKPSVAYFELRDPVVYTTEIEDDYLDALPDDIDELGTEIVADRERQWLLQNDNTFRAKRNIVRTWSNSLASSGLITMKNGKTVVNPEFVNTVLKKFNAINSILLYDESKESDDLLRNVLTNAQFKILDLLNYMSIPYDQETLDYFIESRYLESSKDLANVKLKIDAIAEMFNDKEAGSISYIIRDMFEHAGAQEFELTNGSAKPLHEAYVGYKLDSQINNMALAYHVVHPSSSEFSVVGPNGDMIYPISQNNTITDITRWINDNRDDIIKAMMKSPYAKNSILLKYMKNVHDLAKRSGVENNGAGGRIKVTAMVGLKDKQKKDGKDYFGITPLEDYMIKLGMTFNNMLTLPTMADKKTYFGLSIIDEDNSEVGIHLPKEAITYDNTRFSDKTLNIFAGYFLDELNSLIEYYSRDNIQWLMNNRGKMIKNYHGKAKKVGKQWRMDFSGNGGKFRYMYELVKIATSGGQRINANQYLEFLFKEADAIENGDPNVYGGVGYLLSRDPEYDKTSDMDVDGFELIREFLSILKNSYFKDSVPQETLLNKINEWLYSMTIDEMNEISEVGSLKIVDKEENGRFSPVAIPSYILEEYRDILVKEGKIPDGEYAYSQNKYVDQNTALSAIASHVISTAISVIEFEKVYSGDPANYKYSNIKNKQFATVSVTKTDKKSGIAFKFDISNLQEKHSDKIKRLGAVLSPGQNLMLGEKTTYTNLYISDISAKTRYMKGLKISFGKQIMINYIRKHGYRDVKWFSDYMDAHPEFGNNVESAFEYIYRDISGDVYKTLKKSAGRAVSEFIDNQVKLQTDGYDNINVSDAQVLIRPEMYRAIRKSLGEWSDEAEEAYQILETNDRWMYDEELSKKVEKLELYPLKMTYFSNDSEERSSGKFVNQPLFNKMAIFPVFKYTAASESGQQLYYRMNGYIKQDDGSYKYIEGNELDMVSFESAVKVGLNQQTVDVYDEGVKSLGRIHELFSTSISDITAPQGYSGNMLPVRIQNIDGLRMQLNTESHDDPIRSIGSQMFKIAFSNIEDSALYGWTRKGKTKRYGRQIRNDIMACISALTNKGINNIKSQLYKNGRANPGAVHGLMRKIAERNGLGSSVAEILVSTGLIASLMSRDTFEQSVSSMVNRDVVNINTKGGSAIQQSLFGFTNSLGFDKSTYRRFDQDSAYKMYNGGRNLEWNLPDGSMEIMLGINFFRSIIPGEIWAKGFDAQRNWLIENKIIRGENGNPEDIINLGVGYRIPTQGQSSMFCFKVADVLPKTSGDIIIVPVEFTRQTGSDFDVDKIFLALKSFVDGKLEEVTSFRDLDKYHGDDSNIYKRMILMNSTEGAIGNRLLDNYIDILTDYRMFSDSRASIDTFTELIQNTLLPEISPVYSKYAKGGYELLPSFQAKRKMEFSTGKSGIGPFALNITNLALTQYTHLTMYYGKNEFGFLPLDSILGRDGMPISGWLSAMVNAHVDVAKDPYIFTLNVNKATYNHTNFLLRAGMGLAGLAFIAQPILKRYAALATNSGGLYGRNLSGEEVVMQKSLDIVKGEALNAAMFALKKAENALNAEEFAKWHRKISAFSSSGSSKSIDWSEAFEVDENNIPTKAMDAAKNYRSSDPIKQLESMYFQLLTINSFEKIKRFADELSELVHVSQIDTKKFGNNITAHIDFRNRYERFKYGRHEVAWYINDSPDAHTAEHRKMIREKYGKSYPFRKYFNGLFLDEKFYSATKLTRDIMRCESFTGSDLYNAVFTTLMCNISDSSEYDFEYYDKDGNLKTESRKYYKPIKDEDFVSSMGHAIDNIMRFKALLRFGNDAFKKISKKTKSDVKYSGPIDFVFGGDVNKIKHEVSRLIYGLNKDELQSIPEEERLYMSRSLYENVATFMRFITTAPYNKNPEAMEIADGLISEDGHIINDFLNFLRPQTPSENFNIGRLLLKSSQVGVDPDVKSKLISAFYELLTHKNYRTRRMARDIALYAYYSTYDTNGANSFFDLVPPEFRKQYDDAISMALKSGDERLETIFDTMSNSFYKDLNDVSSGISEEIIDTICRNFWHDDTVVPVYRDRHSKAEHELDVRSIDGINIPGIFVTRYANSPYIKKIIGREVVLYRKSGTIYKTVPDESGGAVTSVESYVYKIVSKLGVHGNGMHMYEFLNNYAIPSIFKNNQLSSQFLGLSGNSQFKDYYNGLSKSNYAVKNSITYTFEKSIINKIQNEYYLDNSEGETVTRNNDGSIMFNVVSSNIKADNAASYRANVIIDFDYNFHDSYKSVHVNSYWDAEKVAQEIVDKFSTTSKDSTAKLYFSGYNNSIKPTSKEIEDYKNYQIERFKRRLRDNNPNIIDDELNKYVDEFIKANESKFANGAEKLKLLKYMVDVLREVMYRGIPIEYVVSNGSEGIGEAAVKAAHIVKSSFTNGTFTSSQPRLQNSATAAYIFVNANDKKFEGLSANYMNFVRQFNSTNILDMDLLSDEEKAKLSEMENRIQKEYEALNSLQLKAEKARQDRKASLRKAVDEMKNNSTLDNESEEPNDVLSEYGVTSSEDIDDVYDDEPEQTCLVQ